MQALRIGYGPIKSVILQLITQFYAAYDSNLKASNHIAFAVAIYRLVLQNSVRFLV